jgi:hypothetical protein
MASAHFCTNCGVPLLEAAKFCGECGHQTQALPAVPVTVAAAAGAAAEHASRTPEPSGNGAATLPVGDAEPLRERSGAGADATTQPRLASAPHGPSVDPSRTATARRRGRWLIPLIVLIVIAGIVAAVLLAGGSDDGADSDATYRKQVADVFGPVLGANKQMSRSLLRLRGSNPVTARADVKTAQQATTAAQGALTALPVPPSESKLAADARQVLDRQVAYLSAVSAVLERPSAPAAGELQTLASNLTSALSAAGPTVAGASPTVTGTDRLVAWAPRAARKLRRDARRASKRQHARDGANGGGSAVVANPYTNGRDCGSGTYAGPNTSCEFARNVRDAYYEAPGDSASVRVFSPVTGQTYTMNCAPSGSGTTCSGANNASVTF